MKNTFMGEYNHTIDQKGRIIVPSKFREMLGEHFIVTKGLDKCLWVFTSDEWEEFSGKLTSLPVAKKDARSVAKFFLAGAMEAETDKMGRILLPQYLRDFAKLDTDVAIIGVGSRVEIWDKAAWDEESTFDDIDEIAEHMGDWGFGI